MKSLHDYQEDAIDFILDRPKCGIFLSMGLGKTIITLKALEWIKNEGGGLPPTLIVAPITVAESVWADEIDEWDVDLTISVCLGKPKDRLSALKRKADVYVINYENLVWLFYQKISGKFGAIVFDELSRMKSTKSQTFKIFKRVRHRFKYIIGLTGMPTGNSLVNLFGEMYTIDGGKTWPVKRDFLSAYFINISKSKNYPRWKLVEDEERLYRRIAPRVLTMHEKDYLELPPFVYKDVWLDMGDVLFDAYKRMERDFYYEAEDIEIEDAASLSAKLRQFTAGFLYKDVGESKKIAVDLHSIKLYAAREILYDDIPDESVLISYQFIHERKILHQAFGKPPILGGGNRKKHQTKKTIDLWNKKKIQYLLGYPKSIGHGLNMQHGGNHILWHSLPWSLDYYNQLNARLRRQGQLKPVVIIRPLIRDTIDEVMADSLRKNEDIQENLYDYLKHYHRGRSRRFG